MGGRNRKRYTSTMHDPLRPEAFAKKCPMLRGQAPGQFPGDSGIAAQGGVPSPGCYFEPSCKCRLPRAARRRSVVYRRAGLRRSQRTRPLVGRTQAPCRRSLQAPRRPFEVILVATAAISPAGRITASTVAVRRGCAKSILQEGGTATLQSLWLRVNSIPSNTSQRWSAARRSSRLVWVSRAGLGPMDQRRGASADKDFLQSSRYRDRGRNGAALGRRSVASDCWRRSRPSPLALAG